METLLLGRALTAVMLALPAAGIDNSGTIARWLGIIQAHIEAGTLASAEFAILMLHIEEMVAEGRDPTPEERESVVQGILANHAAYEAYRSA